MLQTQENKRSDLNSLILKYKIIKYSQPKQVTLEKLPDYWIKTIKGIFTNQSMKTNYLKFSSRITPAFIEINDFKEDLGNRGCKSQQMDRMYRKHITGNKTLRSQYFMVLINLLVRE